MAQAKKNVDANFIAVMVDKTDFATIESGLSAADIDITLWGVAHGGNNSTSAITVSRAASLVHSGIFRISLKSTEIDSHDHYMLRLSSTSTVSCAIQLIPFDVVDHDQSDIFSAISDMRSTMDSQFAVVSNYLSNASNYLSSISVIVSDAHSAAILGASHASDAHSAILLVQSLTSDVDSALTSQFAHISNMLSSISALVSDVDSQLLLNASMISDVQSAVDSQYSDLASKITAGGGGATPSAIADKVWSDYQSKVGTSISNVVSNFSNYLSNISALLSDVDSQLLLNASVISDIQSATDSQYSDLASKITAGGGGATPSAIADKVWSDYGSKVGASISNVVSNFSNYLSNISALLSDVDSQLLLNASVISDIDSQLLLNASVISDIDSALTSQFTALSSQVSDIESQLDVTQSLVSDIDSQLTETHSLISDVDSQLTVTHSLVSDIDSQLTVTHDLLSDVESALDSQFAHLSNAISDHHSAFNARWPATLTELGVAAPSATPSPADALMLQYMALRNRLENTPSWMNIYNDAGTVIARASLVWNSTTSVFDRHELEAGS